MDLVQFAIHCGNALFCHLDYQTQWQGSEFWLQWIVRSGFHSDGHPVDMFKILAGAGAYGIVLFCAKVAIPSHGVLKSKHQNVFVYTGSILRNFARQFQNSFSDIKQHRGAFLTEILSQEVA